MAEPTERDTEEVTDEVKATSKFVRPAELDETGESTDDAPPPLPPSPGDVAVEGWFDSQPTFTAPQVGKKTKLSNASGQISVVRPNADAASRASASAPRGLLLLVAAAALAVGIVIGAFAFGHLVSGDAPDCECSE